MDQGVPACGLTDTEEDITIMGGHLFAKIAAMARLRKRPQEVRQGTCYDQRPFTLDGTLQELEDNFNPAMIILWLQSHLHQ